MEVHVDSEFQSLIPPLTDDEYERLERSLVSHGWQDWREPIITWNGIILDGHNRYRICNEHGIEFKTKEMQFDSRDAAKLWIINHQLERRNLPLAAIGDLKLEEKEIVARQARERMSPGTNQYTERSTPNLGETTKADKHDGETLEQLAKEIPLGRESLRKLDVIKRRAKEGDPIAIRERKALISGEKKSIHGAFIEVTGKKKHRKPGDTTGKDGRKICSMCGEPIDEGDGSPYCASTHIECYNEYKRDKDHERRHNKHIRKNAQFSEDGRRVCSICGEPIEDGDHYTDKLGWCKKCGREHQTEMQRKYRDADHDLRANVATYTVDSLITELTSSVEMMRDTITESIAINRENGVSVSQRRVKAIARSIENVIKEIGKIRND